MTARGRCATWSTAHPPLKAIRTSGWRGKDNCFLRRREALQEASEPSEEAEAPPDEAMDEAAEEAEHSVDDRRTRIRQTARTAPPNKEQARQACLDANARSWRRKDMTSTRSPSTKTAPLPKTQASPL